MKKVKRKSLNTSLSCQNSIRSS